MFTDTFLYPILDVSVSASSNFTEDLLAICDCGIKLLQLRAKKLSADQILKLAEQARSVTAKHGILLIINDHPEIAACVDADGVHIGQDDGEISNARELMGPDRIIGGSAENLREAIYVEKAGADYVGVGSIFPTQTKHDVGVLGLDGLIKISQTVKIPIVAIGGINIQNFTRVLDAGVGTVAVISDIFLAKDIKTRVREYQERYEEYGQ